MLARPLPPGPDKPHVSSAPLWAKNGLPHRKAYDADALIDGLAEREITPIIPPKANRKTKRDCDFALYRERNLIERFFDKIKHFRATATRYDKLATNFLGAVQLVSAIILLN